MNDTDVMRTIENRLGARVVSLRPLSGGCVGEVYLARLADSTTDCPASGTAGATFDDRAGATDDTKSTSAVVKIDRSAQPILKAEGFMLSYLARHTTLPVPKVLVCDDGLLVMSHLPGSSSFDEGAQLHAAELFVQLHSVTSRRAGFECDTLIGSLHQPNPWSVSWILFFADHRLRYMADEAVRADRLPGSIATRVHALADRLGELIDPPREYSLIHGDVWAGNVLAVQGRITGFIDPAIYYAHPEVELAFITLFSCFGEPFFERYQELRGIQGGFFETRRNVYNIYPLLVHVRLFGGGYVQQVSAVLQTLGF